MSATTQHSRQNGGLNDGVDTSHQTNGRSQTRDVVDPLIAKDKSDLDQTLLSNGERKEWSTPGSAAFDLRSDVVTKPTMAMLRAIASTTLMDDVFQEDPTTNDLEALVADLTGKEKGLLVLSGTMGNQVALKTHLGGPPNGILCDSRCHIYQYEAGGAASLSNALLQTVTPKNGCFLTYEEVVEHCVVDDDIHGCPTRIISLENTLNGMILPLAEVEKISKFARENGIIMHLDGARLWEAVAAQTTTLKDYAKHFDSISLCFSKGLGAPIGSIVVGSSTFIKQARRIRKMLGGGLRQAGVISAAARVAVEDTYLGNKLAQSHVNAKKVEGMWVRLGGKLVHPVETNMVWLDIAAAGISSDKFMARAKERGLELRGGRLVLHHQIGAEAIDRLDLLFKDILT